MKKIIAAIAMALLFVGCSGASTENSQPISESGNVQATAETQDTSAPTATVDVTVRVKSIKNDYGWAKVHGSLTNNTSDSLKDVSVNFDASDKSGNSLEGCAAYNTGRIQPGQTWNFDALCDKYKKGMTVEVTGVQSSFEDLEFEVK